MKDGQHRSKRRARCPYCQFRFQRLAVNNDRVPDLAPVICENCARISLLEDGVIRQISEAELGEIQRSPSWKLLAKAREIILKEKP